MSTLAEVNYQPLQSFDKSYRLAARIVFKSPRYIGALIVSCAFIAVGIMINHGAWLLVWLLLIEVMIFLYRESSRLQNAMWASFAAVNGWPIVTNGINGSFVPQSLAHCGYTRKCGPVVDATIDGEEWRIFTYEYTEKQGKNTETYYFTIVQAKLAKKMPYIALDSKKNRFGLREFPEGSQKISLEGDFDTYFSLLCQTGAGIDVLSIITPDIMQTLINKEQAEDIEIIDDNVYFIAAYDMRGGRNLQSMMESVKSLLTELNQRVRTLNYSSDQLLLHNGQKVDAITTANVVYKSPREKYGKLITIASIVIFLTFFIFQTVKILHFYQHPIGSYQQELNVSQ